MTSPCASCRERCCHDYLVTVNSEDVWQLARGLRLDPRQFVVPVAQEDPDAGGFLLERGGPPHHLALDKAAGGKPNRPCVFWLGLGPGTGRCGVYGLRPGVCCIYPARLVDGVVVRREDVLCPSGAWRDGELEDPEWRRQLDRMQVAYDVHWLLVARWNFHVEQTRRPDQLSFHGFLTYLLAFHDGLSLVWEEVPGRDRDVLVSGWAARAAAGESPLATYVPELAEWAEVFAAVRELATAFFPDDLESRPSPFAPVG